jgi:hypothetical protein
MIRLFYFAVSALLISLCIEQALAQSLTSASGGEASQPRFQSSAASNIQYATTPPTAPASDNMSERCKALSSAIGATTATPDRGVRQTPRTPYNDHGPIYNQQAYDKRAEAESAYGGLHCGQ